MRFAITFSFAVCTLAVGCVSSPSTPPQATSTSEPEATPTTEPQATSTTERMSPEAREYLSEALDIIQQNALKRDEIDWETLREQVFRWVNDIREPSDTYVFIEFVIGLLDDHHSRFLTRDEASKAYYPTARPDSEPQAEVIEGKLGMIVLPFVVGVGSVARAYPPPYHDAIRELATNDPCGWIVDLRKNGGGNMYPMLAAIGPILGEGQVGGFLYPDGRKEYWYYIDGEARLDEEVYSRVENPYELEDSLPLVAVLTGQRTASAGEAIAAAFRGRPNTRSFGEDTVGLSTSIDDFMLSDGAVIALAVATFADREGNEYEGRITPDEIVHEDPSGNFDRPLEAATEWLLSHPICSSEGGTGGE